MSNWNLLPKLTQAHFAPVVILQLQTRSGLCVVSKNMNDVAK
jgi:hypothetical protein